MSKKSKPKKNTPSKKDINATEVRWLKRKATLRKIRREELKKEKEAKAAALKKKRSDASKKGAETKRVKKEEAEKASAAPTKPPVTPPGTASPKPKAEKKPEIILPVVERSATRPQGIRVVQILASGHTNREYLCKLENGTTQHVPKELFK